MDIIYYKRNLDLDIETQDIRKFFGEEKSW